MLTVLILDSHPAAALKLLASQEMLILSASTASQAWEALTRYHPDLLICDLSMPEVSAQAVLDRVREQAPETRVLLTGPLICRIHALSLVEQGQAAGFIAKPWSAAQVRAALRTALPEIMEQKTPARPATGTAAHPPTRPHTAAPSTEEPRYRLDEKIGEGGTGQVYRAHDLLLDMPVAIKLLHPALSKNAQELAALQSEARIAMQLSHRHIVRLYNLDKRGNIYLLIMEFIRGHNLHVTLKDPASRDPARVLAVSSAIARALDYAHAHGVLHCDLTPSNVLIREDGVVKLIDFGIASLINRQAKRGEFVAGTPSYMSPEQLRGDPQDARSDLFSFAVILYQMLTGYLPQTPNATTEDLAFRPRPALTGIAPDVANVLTQGLAMDRNERWPTAGNLLQALEKALG